MTPTEEKVARIMSSPERALAFDEITPATIMATDARIDGIDVDDFVADLEDEFGPIVREIPWLRFSDQRASFRGFGCVIAPFWLLWRAMLYPINQEFVPLPNGGEEDLTVGHIARVIDAGYWIEPDQVEP